MYFDSLNEFGVQNNPSLEFFIEGTLMVPKALKELMGRQCLISGGCGCKEGVTTQSQGSYLCGSAKLVFCCATFQHTAVLRAVPI